MERLCDHELYHSKVFKDILKEEKNRSQMKWGLLTTGAPDCFSSSITKSLITKYLLPFT